MPGFVQGMALIRGLAVPVIDMATVMGIAGASEATRFIVLRAADRNVAAAVEAVRGFIHLPGTLLGKVPPLLENASSAFVEAVSSLDQTLLFVLNAARLMPPELLEELLERGGGD
jgi:chemotaxis signal transduction protein